MLSLGRQGPTDPEWHLVKRWCTNHEAKCATTLKDSHHLAPVIAVMSFVLFYYLSVLSMMLPSLCLFPPPPHIALWPCPWPSACPLWVSCSFPQETLPILLGCPSIPMCGNQKGELVFSLSNSRTILWIECGSQIPYINHLEWNHQAPPPFSAVCRWIRWVLRNQSRPGVHFGQNCLLRLAAAF